MSELDYLQKALDNRPNHLAKPNCDCEQCRMVKEEKEWFEDFDKKFSAFHKDYIPIPRKQLEDNLMSLGFNWGKFISGIFYAPEKLKEVQK